jgi:copper chaperone CopZ
VSCTKAVRETLSRLDKVKKVDVNFEAKLALVVMDGKSELSKKTIADAFEGSRFSVADFADADEVFVVGVSGMT